MPEAESTRSRPLSFTAPPSRCGSTSSPIRSLSLSKRPSLQAHQQAKKAVVDPSQTNRLIIFFINPYANLHRIILILRVSVHRLVVIVWIEAIDRCARKGFNQSLTHFIVIDECREPY